MCCRATEKHRDAFQYSEGSHRSILSQVRRNLPSPPRRHAQSSGEHGAGLYRMTSWFALRVAFRHLDTTRQRKERMKKVRTQRPGACARMYAPPPSLTCCVATCRRTGIWIRVLSGPGSRIAVLMVGTRRFDARLHSVSLTSAFPSGSDDAHVGESRRAPPIGWAKKIYVILCFPPGNLAQLNGRSARPSGHAHVMIPRRFNYQTSKCVYILVV